MRFIIFRDGNNTGMIKTVDVKLFGCNFSHVIKNIIRVKINLFFRVKASAQIQMPLMPAL